MAQLLFLSHSIQETPFLKHAIRLVRHVNKFHKPTMQATRHRKESQTDRHYHILIISHTISEASLHVLDVVVVCSCYPGILYGCQMDFVKDWPQYALEGEASHYLERHKVLGDISEQTR